MAKIPQRKCPHPRHARYAGTCNVCGKEGLGIAPAPKVLEPGIYKLDFQVANIYNADGRSSDWDKLRNISPGVYYVFDNFTNIHPNEAGWQSYGCRIERADGRGYNYMTPLHGTYDALVDALVKVDGTDEEWVDYQHRKPGQHYEASPEMVLAQLMKQGRVNRNDVATAIEANKKESENERA